MQTCPKCGYVRTEGDAASPAECPRCGIIYEKFKITCLHCSKTSSANEITKPGMCPHCGIDIKSAAKSNASKSRASRNWGQVVSEFLRAQSSESTPTSTLRFRDWAIFAVIFYVAFYVIFSGDTSKSVPQERITSSPSVPDPRTVFRAGTQLESNEFATLVDKHFPNAKYLPDQTIQVRSAGKSYLIRTRKLSDTGPAIYEILSVSEGSATTPEQPVIGTRCDVDAAMQVTSNMRQMAEAQEFGDQKSLTFYADWWPTVRPRLREFVQAAADADACVTGKARRIDFYRSTGDRVAFADPNRGIKVLID